MLNNCHALSHLIQTKVNYLNTVQPPYSKWKPKLYMDAVRLKNSPNLNPGSPARWGLLIHEARGFLACLDPSFQFSYPLSQWGTQTATERSKAILRRIKAEEPVGPVCPRPQGGAPTWNAARFSRNQPGSWSLSWLPQATLITESVVGCKEELFRGGKLPWVLYLPINTSNS